jgi:hypothetical protein
VGHAHLGTLKYKICGCSNVMEFLFYFELCVE